jgi:hypothetical protein
MQMSNPLTKLSENDYLLNFLFPTRGSMWTYDIDLTLAFWHLPFVA